MTIQARRALWYNNVPWQGVRQCVHAFTGMLVTFIGVKICMHDMYLDVISVCGSLWRANEVQAPHAYSGACECARAKAEEQAAAKKAEEEEEAARKAEEEGEGEGEEGEGDE
eukprot:1152151-Pelagomonas_calceolata.AAC.2